MSSRALRVICCGLLVVLSGVDQLSMGEPTDDRSTTVTISFDAQKPGRYRGDRLKADWPGLVFSQVDRASIVTRTDALRGHNGQALRVTYPAGKIGSRESGAQFKTKLVPRDEYSLDYRVRFGHGNGDQWEFGRGGKLPGLAGGDCNTGGRRSTGDGWSTRYMWREQGRMVAYVYHRDQKTQYGDQWPLDTTFKPGKWYRLTQRVRVNSADKADGILQVWVDGRPVLDRRDVRFRSGDKAPVDHFLFSTFYGGSNHSWAPKIDTIAYFDEIHLQPTPFADLEMPTEPDVIR